MPVSNRMNPRSNLIRDLTNLCSFTWFIKHYLLVQAEISRNFVNNERLVSAWRIFDFKSDVTIGLARSRRVRARRTDFVRVHGNDLNRSHERSCCLDFLKNIPGLGIRSAEYGCIVVQVQHLYRNLQQRRLQLGLQLKENVWLMAQYPLWFHLFLITFRCSQAYANEGYASLH